MKGAHGGGGVGWGGRRAQGASEGQCGLLGPRSGLPAPIRVDFRPSHTHSPQSSGMRPRGTFIRAGGHSCGTLHARTSAAVRGEDVLPHLPPTLPSAEPKTTPPSSPSSPCLTFVAVAGLAPAARSVRRASRWPK